MSNEGQIESEKVTVQKVFSEDFWFRIPNYQRPYVWGKDEISELIDDLNYASEHNPEGQYFLGSMVLRKVTKSKDEVHFKEYEVLDGQQRLTTLMMILACIRDYHGKADNLTKDDQLLETCRKALHQKENKWQNVPGRNRIVYDIRGNVDGFINNYIIKDNGTTSPVLSDLEDRKNISLLNMHSGMETIHECFDDMTSPNDFERFVKYLLNKAIFIYVATENLDDAFRLFTILNDRGIPLSNSDIIKAKNLGAIIREDERSKWAEYWENVESNLGRDGFDRFLSLVRTILVKDKARQGLLKEFDERIWESKPPLLPLGSATFEAIKTYKNAFDEAISFEGLPSSLGNSYRNRINIMRKGFSSNDWVPPILLWFERFRDKKLLELLVKVDNKFSADWILKLTPTQRINNMNEILKVIQAASEPEDALSSSAFSFNRDQLKAVFDLPIYWERFVKYILLRLEYLLYSHEAQLSLPDEISVEHILPQTPSRQSQWVKDFSDEQREFWVHRLGNLMLLSRRKNTSLSNLDFLEKRERYFKDRIENLPNSLRILASNAFTPADLESRHKELIYKLYSSYNIL